MKNKEDLIREKMNSKIDKGFSIPRNKPSNNSNENNSSNNNKPKNKK